MSSGTAETTPLGEASGGPHSVVDVPGPAAEEHITNHPDRKDAKSLPSSEGSQAPQPATAEKSQPEARKEPAANSDKQPQIDSQARGLEIGAEVWNTYVKEADKSDKELSEGWNKMLDVILLFAALFSAISTAFVLESSKDLKPDPAETSAARLLTITHLLVAMSNQSVVTMVMLPPDDSAFTPSTSALAVNVLWFLSLILSVAVTLIAMLAKEWCHLFMAGRDGNMHDQARKRQQRLEGLKRWKMEGVIPALPTLMHVALFLFAVGLCLYLWNIHVGVAIPVILISVAAGVLYLSAIVLPFIHDYCPYETTLSKQLKPWIRAWFYAWFRSGHQPESLEKSSHRVPMDALTNRVLIWLVTNCENPRAVDVALQSIAGADETLDYAPLMACNVAPLMISRIHDCFAAQQLPMAASLIQLRELSLEQYGLAMSYARSLIVLVVNTKYFQGYPAQEKLLQAILPLGLFHSYEYDALLGLTRTAQKTQKELSSHAPLLQVLLHSLWGQLAARLRTTLAPPETEARIGLLKQTLEILSCTPVSHLREASIPQTLAVVTLRLNTRLLEHFETESPALLPLFHNCPAAKGEHQRTRVENLRSTCLLVLGLTGLIEASQDPGCAGAFGPGDMGVVFEHLRELRADWKSSASFAPLDSAGTFDLRRYAVETVLGYYRQELTRYSATNESVCSKLLRDILPCEWRGEPWITDLVFNTLTGSDSDDMRDISADFLYYNSEYVSRHTQVYNILYEMFHMSRHESLSYFRWNLCVYLRNITRRFRTIAMTNSNDSENMKGAIDALLERLVKNDLLGNLVLSAYGSDTSELEDDYWQELRCGPTTRFWVERIVSLAQKSNSQQAASNGPGPPNVADRIRGFCLAMNEFPVKAQPNNKRKDEVDPMGYSKRWLHMVAEDRRTYLSEFKKVLLREIGDNTAQLATINEPQQPSIPVIQPLIQPEDDRPVDQSHTSIHIPEGEAIEEIVTPGTST